MLTYSTKLRKLFCYGKKSKLLQGLIELEKI